MSHPVWVRGLKQRLGIGSMTIRTSHPVWVRGLKPCPSRNPLSSERRRTRVGAWIETNDKLNDKSKELSHPVWVRGLKQQRRVSWHV